MGRHFSCVHPRQKVSQTPNGLLSGVNLWRLFLKIHGVLLAVVVMYLW